MSEENAPVEGEEIEVLEEVDAPELEPGELADQAAEVMAAAVEEANGELRSQDAPMTAAEIRRRMAEVGRKRRLG